MKCFFVLCIQEVYLIFLLSRNGQNFRIYSINTNVRISVYVIIFVSLSCMSKTFCPYLYKVSRYIKMGRTSWTFSTLFFWCYLLQNVGSEFILKKLGPVWKLRSRINEICAIENIEIAPPPPRQAETFCCFWSVYTHTLTHYTIHILWQLYSIVEVVRGTKINES